MPDLSTTYLTLRLPHPFMIGASPFADHLDTAKRLEDGGSAAVVMRSLFEEQITMAATGRIYEMDPCDEAFAPLLKDFPLPELCSLAPDEYLERIHRLKSALAVPVVASLNGTTTHSWLAFARNVEQAGADALELNMYHVVADPRRSALAVESEIRDMVTTLKRSRRIPIAVKLCPFYTSMAHFACSLDEAGADGLVLFNRLYHSDIDVDTFAAAPRVVLSTSAELPLRLEWIRILRGRVRASLAATGGVAEPADGIKAILAGADAVQMVSAIVRNGPAYFGALREGLVRWMESRGFASLAEARGLAAMPHDADPALAERTAYIRTLQSAPATWTGEGKEGSQR